MDEHNRNDSPQAVADFTALYRSWRGTVERVAFVVLRDRDAAEDVVQTVFLRLWSSRKENSIRNPAS